MFDVDSPIEYRSHDFGGLRDYQNIHGELTQRGQDGVIARHLPHPDDEDREVRLEFVVWKPDQIRILEVIPEIQPSP